MYNMIIKSGLKYQSIVIDEIHDNLPIGTYILKYNVKEGYYLQKTLEFIIPDKIYGDTSIVNKVINTYNVRQNRNLGVLFEGIKGCSKTLLCKLICQKINLPVILIQESFEEPVEAVAFLSSSEFNNCVLFFDEFEKVFDKSAQTPLLTLIDGTSATHNLYLFTSNTDVYKRELINRPSRIYYHIMMKSLDKDTIDEVINDKLINKQYKENLLNILNSFMELNFDTLLSIIEEMNIYNCDVNDIIKDFGFIHESIAIEVFCHIKETNKIVNVTYDYVYTGGQALEVKKPIGDGSDFSYYTIPKETIKKVNKHWEAYDDIGNKYIIKPSSSITSIF